MACARSASAVVFDVQGIAAQFGSALALPNGGGLLLAEKSRLLSAPFSTKLSANKRSIFRLQKKSNVHPLLQFWFSPRCHLIGMLLLFLLLPDSVFAQKMRLARQFPSTEISKKDVACLLEDRAGFLWFGSNGLFRFDGHDQKPYLVATDDSLSQKTGKVLALLEDRRGNIWAGCEQGLFWYDRRSDRLRTFAKNTFLNQKGVAPAIQSLLEDSSGRLWAGGDDRVFLIEQPAETGAFRAFDLLENDINYQVRTGVRSILEDFAGGIWLANTNGLWRLGKDFSLKKYAPGNSQQSKFGFRILQADRDAAGHFLLATYSGLWRFEPQSGVFSRLEIPSQKTDLVRRVQPLADGDLLISTSNGIWRRAARDGSFEQVQGLSPKFLASLKSIYQDRRGNIWVSSTGGLRCLDDLSPHHLPFYRIESGDSAQDNHFFRVMQDSAGGFWFRVIYSGLGHCRELGGDFEILLRPPPNINVEEVKDFCTDPDGQVWVLTLTYGLYLFPKGQKIGHPLPLGDSVLQSFALEIKPDLQDNRWLWFSSGYGLCRVDRLLHTTRWFSPARDLPWVGRNDIVFFHPDERGQVWCTMRKPDGKSVVGYFDKAQEKFFAEEPQPPHPDRFFHFKKVATDKLWVGSSVGILEIDTRKKEQRWVAGLPVKNVSSLSPDAAGNVWFASGRRIFKFDGKKYKVFHADRRLGNFMWASATRLRDGRLMFGASNGLCVFDPALVRPDTCRPRLCLTGFQVHGKEKNFGTAPELVKKISLSFDENVVKFQFSARVLHRPDLVRYRYQLEGADRDWVKLDSNQHQIPFVNLASGKYVFKLAAAAADGQWTDEANSLRIELEIRPPWFRSAWAYFFYFAAAVALLFWWRRYDLRRHLAQAEARRLRELDSIKSRLFTNITHEFRTPLTVILGEAAELEKRAGEKQRSGLAAIQRQGRQLLHLVNQLLDLSKVEAGALRAEMVQGDVVLFLKYLLESFHSLAESRRIEISFESDAAEFWMDYDPDKLQKIVGNLISNALKFTPSGGQVLLKLSSNQNFDSSNFQFLIQIMDNGQGIPPEKMPHIFERFYQADDSPVRRAEGSGIGLTLAKELVGLLGGDIRAESPPTGQASGAVFTVLLPVRREAEKRHFQLENLEKSAVENMKAALEPEAKDFPALEKNAARPQLLLVEDNADVMRYMVSLLAENYQIHRARNGREGLESATRLVPDLLVSDVMMPEMDGYELCRRLKNDERTSHIPIVLLTAKADQPSKIEGLTQGADAYLAKPFDPDELRVRLAKLLELRRRLQERYADPTAFSNLIKMEKTAAAPLSLDERFLQKVVKIVEENLGDETFDMPELCAALHMSRSNLFRKMKALTGQSVTHFIRNLRLEKAKLLLETSDLNVTEVCFEVGFNSPNYFSRAFQERFGMPPSERRRG